MGDEPAGASIVVAVGQAEQARTRVCVVAVLTAEALPNVASVLWLAYDLYPQVAK